MMREHYNPKLWAYSVVGLLLFLREILVTSNIPQIFGGITKGSKLDTMQHGARCSSCCRVGIPNNGRHQTVHWAL